MKSITVGEPIALLMDIRSPETPFFANVGDRYIVADEGVDPMMPSGHMVLLKNYGGAIKVDKSMVIHLDDWKNIYNSVLDMALRSAKL